MTECNVNNGIIEPCNLLSRSLTEAKKGLQIFTLWDIRTHEPSRDFVTVYSGEFSKKGIVANYCPFCGNDISEHVRQMHEEAENQTNET